MTSLGHTTLIANPAAKNGAGAEAAEVAARLLEAKLGSGNFTLLLTEQPRHAVALAAGLPESCDTVIALGGDGLVHEVASGLMERPRSQRPVLGLVPMGSGNDYAETLGMAYRIPDAVDQLLAGRTHPADLGLCNGRYFVETLSFGLDAAIALDTVERRVKTGRSGTLLYLGSAIDQLFHHLNVNSYRAVLEGNGERRELEGSCYLFAVQIGPTYGGHFRITPQASIDDGLLDIAIAHPPLNPWTALALLLRARFGRHTGNPHIEFDKSPSLTVDFAREPKAQIDGEQITGTHFDIRCVPHAIEVLVGRERF